MSSSYNWMPDWLRKFLNLDEARPNYGPSSGSSSEPPVRQPSYMAAARPATTYTPPAARSAESYTPPALPPTAYGQTAPSEGAGSSRFSSYLGTATPEEAVKRFSSFSSGPPSGSGSTPPDGNGPRRPAAGPPALVPRPAPVNPPSGPGPMSEGATGGFVEPIGFAVRSFARGALPPQGIEQFSRELSATLTDVWNFYTYWVRFETEDILNAGREVLDALTNLLPNAGEGSAASSPMRRIKVLPQTEGDPGVRRPLPPPPPAPTAVFSPTVTADDAVIPPGGRDTSAEFAARMAKETAPVAKDVAEATRKATESPSAAVVPPTSAPSAAPVRPSAPTSSAAPTSVPSAAPVAPPSPPVVPSAAPVRPSAPISSTAPTSVPSAAPVAPPSPPVVPSAAPVAPSVVPPSAAPRTPTPPVTPPSAPPEAPTGTPRAGGGDGSRNKKDKGRKN